MTPRPASNTFRRWLLVNRLVNEERKRLLLERRRARRLLRNNNDPLIHLTDAEFVKNYRLGKDAVRSLADELRPFLPRKKRRDAMSVMVKVLIALSFFASGSYQGVIGQGAYNNASQKSVSRAVRQVTHALNAIYHKYVRWPMTSQERNNVKTKFFHKFGIPGVTGCIDGTHVAILRPVHNEERFLCRKSYHSLNVMIICDSDLRIMCVDPANPGSAHDSMVWNLHPLANHLSQLHDDGEQLFLLGDSGYPLRNTVITPILNTAEGTPEHAFYKKHVTARNTIERCIGVLKARFRCLLLARTLHYTPHTAGNIVNACAVLHNIALATNAPPQQLTPAEAADESRLQNMIQRVRVAAVVAAEATARNRVLPALQQGRALQKALVDLLWRQRQR